MNKPLGDNLKEFKNKLRSRRTLTGYLEKISLPIIEKPTELASFLKIDYSTLKRYCIDQKALSPKDYAYRRFHLNKKSGGKRLILAPKKELKLIQDKIYEEILKKLDPGEFAHGFRANHSTVTNAEIHLNAKIIYNLDLKNFFPSIKYDKVLDVYKDAGYSGLISLLLAALTTIPYRQYRKDFWRLKNNKSKNLPQGAPTSPALSNLVSIYLDKELNWIASNYGFKYSRYADDLTFSSKTKSVLQEELKQKIFNCIEDHGFRINLKKVNLSAENIKSRNFKYRRVTGIIVHEDYLSLPRAWIRKLRAALHELKKININEDQLYAMDLLKNIEGRCAYATMVNKEKYFHFYETFKNLKNQILEFKDRIKFCPFCGTEINNPKLVYCYKCGKNVND